MANSRANVSDPYDSDSSEDFVIVQYLQSSSLNPARLTAQPRVHEQDLCFQHDTLPSPGHFRLLRLSAGQGTFNITGTLTPFEIDSPSCPAYRAVSYTWGTDEASHHIRIDGKPFNIRRNLMSLLKGIRDSTNGCWLWIDAICIDQQSNEERNHQVRLMGKIYSNANVVVAWLESSGESLLLHRDIQYACDFMKKATSFNGSETSLAAYCESVKPTAMVWDRAMVRDRGQKIRWEEEWLCFAMFCKLKYWTRKWIIQEVVAARTVVLLTSSGECPMTVVEDFFGQLEGNPYHHASRFDSWSSRDRNKLQENELTRYRKWETRFGHLQSSSTPAALLARHRLARRKGQDYPQRLHELLPRYELYECHEPRDHVYALFNLIGPHRKHLDVNYAQNPADRCQSILHFMRQYDGLSSLDTVWCTALLMTKLNMKAEKSLRAALQGNSGSGAVSLAVTAYVRGQVILQEESSAILSLRKTIASLYPMQTWSIEKAEPYWQVRSNSTQENSFSGLIVSPYDLICFKIRDTNLVGLAAAPLKDRDQIWQFRQTNLAFVVRVLEDGHITIVGRTYVFRNDANELTSDRLEPNTQSSSLIQPKENTAASIPPKQHDILLSCADLLELAFWADSVGPTPNPFSS